MGAVGMVSFLRNLRKGRLVALIVLSMASAMGRADADGPDFFRAQGIAAGDTLNIRSAPNAKASRLGEIPPNATCVRNLGCRGGLSFREYTELSPAQRDQRLKRNPRWCKVEYRGITGWVAGRYLAEGSCP